MSRTNVRGLTVFQPHASFIVVGEKVLETRDWIPGVESGTPEGWRGTLLIVSGEDSLEHDKWMWRSFFKPEVRAAQEHLYKIDHHAREGKQGKCLLSSGCVLGAVDLVATYEMKGYETTNTGLIVFTTEHPPMPISKQEAGLGIYERGRYIWKLENPRRLTIPIPFVGRRRLFEVPEEILLQIEAQGVKL